MVGSRASSWLLGLLLAVAACNIYIVSTINAPQGGCLCDKLTDLDGQWDPNKVLASAQLGEWLGAYDVKGKIRLPRNAPGTPGMNLEYFTAINKTNVLKANAATTLKACCVACKSLKGCVYYEFFKSAGDVKLLSGGATLDATKTCFLLGLFAGPVDLSTGLFSPLAPPKKTQIVIFKKRTPNYVLSYFGGTCNAPTGGKAPAPGGGKAPAPGGNATAPGSGKSPAPSGNATAPGSGKAPAPGGGKAPAPGINGTAPSGGKAPSPLGKAPSP